MNEPMDPNADTAPAVPAASDVPGTPSAALPAPATGENAQITTDPDDVALLALVDRLAAVLEGSDLSELEIQVGGTGLIVRKPVAVAVAAPAGTAPAGFAGEPVAGPGAAPSGPTRPSVKAPLTGIWYASPSPGSGPYVVGGGEVAVGQVIGLIEAMKLFNEIKSDLAGRVGKVHAQDGKLVKAKQPLIEVEPL